MQTFNYKSTDYVEVFQLLGEMEACVNRVKALCKQIESGFGEG